MNLDRNAWARLRQIAEILARHGLIWVSDSIGLSGFLGLKGRIRAKNLPDRDANWPQRVSRVLAELGPTYVKLGQLASLRPDVLPDPLVRSLETLQDDVPPFGYQDARQAMQAAWGRPIEEVLAYIDPVPMAAASIGQVHRARLIDGRPVVIKVRRPKIVERAESDFRILQVVAQRAEKRSPWARQNQLCQMVDELVHTMRDELDFTIEAHNTDTARRNLAFNPELVVPAVIWELTRPDVLVLETLGGVKINDVRALRGHGLDPERVAKNFVTTLYQQIFRIGFFHADPHPGNVHVDPAGRLIFLDWGMVGMLSRDMRNLSVRLVLGLVQGRSEAVAEALTAMGSTGGQPERRALIRDIDRLRRRYYETPLKDFNLGHALGDLFGVAQRHRLRIPAEYLLMAKAAVIADGVVRALDPDFSLLQMGKPMAWELLGARLNPRNWGPEAVGEVSKLGENLLTIPQELEQALRTLSRGEIRIVLEHKNIDRILEHWAKLADHLAFSFLLGAVVLGIALVVHPTQLDRMAGMRLGEYAFLAMVAVALWVLVGVLRRHRL